MEPYRLERGPGGRALVRVPYREHALPTHPMFNKSTGVTRGCGGGSTTTSSTSS